MNYAELTQSIQDYTENDETTFVAEIPTFVRQTEEKIHRTVLIPELRKNVTANVTQNVRFVARPSDFLAPFSMAVIDSSGDYHFLLNKDVALLYGSLVEAYIFMKGDADLLAQYEAKYQEALKRLTILGEGRLKRDSYRSEPRLEM